MATLLSYDSPFPVYGLSYTNSKHDPHRMALGSFVLRGGQNYLQVIGLKGDHQQPHLAPLASTPHPYPPTCVAWQPHSTSSSRELVATTGDALRIWEYSPPDGGGGNDGKLRERGMLCHTKALPTSTPSASPGNTPSPGGSAGNGTQQNSPAPITNLSWNALNPSLVVTSSIDTTCTVWDVQASVAVTQLIAHDREVYDVAWLPGGTEVFVSVGEDGSLRAFDLRSLEHSTILYETPASAKASSSSGALMRIAFNPSDAHYLATFHGNSGDVSVLDMRAPGLPVVELKGHGKVGGRVGAIGWGESNGKGGGGLCSGGNDSLLLLWDASTTALPPSQPLNPAAPGILPSNDASAPDGDTAAAIPQRSDPSMTYTAPGEVDSVGWGVGGEWVACAGSRAGRGVEVAEPRKEEERQPKGRARNEQVEATGYFEVPQEHGKTVGLFAGVFGRDALMSGVQMLPVSLGGSLVSLVVGPLVAHFNTPRPFLWIGLGFSFLGFGIMILMDETTSTAGQEGFPLLAGLFSGLIFQPPLIALQSAMPLKDMATTTSAFMLCRSFGSTLGVAVSGTILFTRLRNNLAALPDLPATLTSSVLAGDFKSIALVDDAFSRQAIRKALAESIRVIWIVVTPLIGAAFVGSLFIRHYSLVRKYKTATIDDEAVVEGEKGGLGNEKERVKGAMLVVERI